MVVVVSFAQKKNRFEMIIIPIAVLRQCTFIVEFDRRANGKMQTEAERPRSDNEPRVAMNIKT